MPVEGAPFTSRQVLDQRPAWDGSGNQLPAAVLLDDVQESSASSFYDEALAPL